MYHIFFILSSVYERIGCFHVLDVVISAEMSIGVLISFFDHIFVEYMSKNGIAGSYMVTTFLGF